MRLLLVIATFTIAALFNSFNATPVAAAPLCQEACYAWCAENRLGPDGRMTQGCKDACASRSVCRTIGPACRRYCETTATNKAGCREDCRLRAKGLAILKRFGLR